MMADVTEYRTTRTMHPRPPRRPFGHRTDVLRDTWRPRADAARHAAWVAVAGLAVTLLLGLVGESPHALAAPGGVATAAGRATGLIGTYGLLIMVVFVGRLQLVERVVGQDRLLRWHRRIAPYVLLLLLAHAVLITIGYGQVARHGVLHELVTLVLTMPGMLTAVAGLAMIVAAAVTSYRIARRRMRYETWWVVHLYSYLGLALSFSHQIATGSMFVGHPVNRAFWIALWVATAGIVLYYRVLLPIARSLRHRLRVVSVTSEGPGVVSIVLRGHRLDKLALRGGQFLQWRFLVRGLWWQAHPYSISAMPQRDHVRVTVKRLGDHSDALTRIRPGTWVGIEGPYGTFTRHALRSRSVLLVGAGVGVTPIRALLEDLPRDVDVMVMLRANTAADLVLANEVLTLAEERGGRTVALVGPPEEVRLDPTAIHHMVPDVRQRQVYMCGPQGFVNRMIATLAQLGVSPRHIQVEEFAF
jgi:predicted ferric reductase